MKKEYSVAEQKEAFIKAMNEYSKKTDPHSEFEEYITENPIPKVEELELAPTITFNIKDEGF